MKTMLVLSILLAALAGLADAQNPAFEVVSVPTGLAS
jgi:hypothetical protein